MRIEEKRDLFTSMLLDTMSKQAIKIFNDDTYEVEDMRTVATLFDSFKNSCNDYKRIQVNVFTKNNQVNTALYLVMSRDVKEGISDPYGFTFEIDLFKSSFYNSWNYASGVLCRDLPKIIEKVASANNVELKGDDTTTTLKMYINASTKEEFDKSSQQATNILKQIINDFNEVAYTKVKEHEEKQKQAMEFFKNRACAKAKEEQKIFAIEIGGNKIELNNEELSHLKKQLITLN